VATEPSPPVKAGFLNRVESVRGLAALCVAVTHTLGYLSVNQGLGRSLLDQTSARGLPVKQTEAAWQAIFNAFKTA